MLTLSQGLVSLPPRSATSGQAFMKNQKFNSQSAFTLIELVVSMAVIFILVGLSFAGYASLNQRQILISAGQTLKNVIRDAQSRAYNNEIDCNICNCTINQTANFVGWYVDFGSKTIYGQCGTSSFGPPRSFNLSDEIIITPYLTPPATPPVKLLFKNSPPGVSQGATICLSKSNLGNFYTIRVSSAGVVSDDGGLVAVCP